MSWMPKADRIAAVGDGTRLNKTVAKIDLAKMRTSCQINYPESPSKYHVAPTVGGPPKPAPPRTSIDHMNPPKADQLNPGDIKKEIVESFVGNHSGLYSDWIATSPSAGKPPPRRRPSPMRHRRKKPPPAAAETKKRHGSHVMDHHVNRHSREAIKAEVDARRAQMNRKPDNVMLGGAVMKRRELAQLQKDSGFGIKELRAVMDSFKAHSSYDADHNSVNKEHFCEIMSDVFDHMTPEMSNRLFESMDDDGSGMVDYRELIKGCAKLVHDADTDERFRIIFDVYDTDGGGTISATELMRIAHDKGSEMGDSLELVKNVMSTIDTDRTGTVSFDEFLTACKETPLLLDAFEQLLPSPSLLKRHVEDLNKIPPGGTFNWERLNDMSAFLRQRSARGTDAAAINRSDFRSLMEDFFGYHDPILTGNMFDSMDHDNSGTIDFKELLSGLSTALRGAPEQRLDFYFNLYDMNDSGSIDEDDLYRLLERGHSSMRNMHNTQMTKGLLEQHGLSDLDADGDGKISHEEFIQAVTKNPEIMKIFGQVVH